MGRVLTLAFALALALPAAAQETYTLHGEDSAGDAVAGWVRIEADGRLAYCNRAGRKTYRTSIQARVADGVYRGSQAESGGLMGALSGARQDGVGESLVVRRLGSEVEVEFVRGDYSARTRGALDTARYDLKLLHDSVPHARLHLESTTRLSQPQASTSREVLRYESRMNASREGRIYQEISKDGKQLVKPGSKQVLQRTDEGWDPTWTFGLRKAKKHRLLGASFRSVGVTELVPVEPVAVGEAWTLPVAEAPRWLGVGGEDPEGSVRGQLIGVDPVEGGFNYRIVFTFELRLSLPGLAGRTSIEVRQWVTQSPSLHTANVQARVRGKLAFDGSPLSQESEQTLVQRTLPD